MPRALAAAGDDTAAAPTALVEALDARTASPPRPARSALAGSPASSSARATARCSTSPPSSRRSARPRPTRSRACSASTSSAWRPWPRRPRLHHLRPHRWDRHSPPEDHAAHGCLTQRLPTPARAPRTSTLTHVQEGSSMTTHIEELNPGLKGIGTYEYGWADTDAAGSTRAVASTRTSCATSRRSRASRSGCSTCGSRGCGCSARSRCRPGAPTCPASTSTTSSTSCGRPRSRRPPGTTCPTDIKNTYDRLGIPEAEKQRLVAGVAAQYESEVVYHQIREDLEEQGVLFLDTDTGAARARGPVPRVLRHGDPGRRQQVRRAQHRGVVGRLVHLRARRACKVDIPLQAYFRINTENMGQFERTLIIADEGSYVHYVEGCTAPIYSSDSLHSAVVEIIVKKDARVRYTTIQNWSNNVYNLVTKRTAVQAGGDDGVDRRQHRLQGHDEVPRRATCSASTPRARRCRSRSPARASTRTPAPRWCTPRRTRPRRSSRKSVARGGGRTSYRGLVQVQEGAHGSQLDGEVRRAARRHDQPLATPTPTSTSARTTCRWATRRPSPRSARTSSST